MKTLGRIVMILMVFALAMGIIYVAVNAATSGSALTAPQFPSDNERPSLPDRQQTEPRAELGSGWIFGALKNTGIIIIVVTLIVVPKGWLDRKKRIAHTAS